MFSIIQKFFKVIHNYATLFNLITSIFLIKISPFILNIKILTKKNSKEIHIVNKGISIDSSIEGELNFDILAG